MTPGNDLWTSVDRYLGEQLIGSDAALDNAAATSATAGLPDIAVSPTHGKLLHLLATSIGAKQILEIGTLGGYSTIWLARALPPGGSLITLEADPRHADIARANIGQSGLSRLVQVRVGAALDTLPKLAAEGMGPFDFVFIDADKVNTSAYFTWAMTLARPGALIVIDNVVRDGAIADGSSTDASVQAMRRFFDLVRFDARVDVTAVQTVGVKGYDGFALVRVKDPAPPEPRRP
jgi:predicted O-methyltransferase YrrM